MSFAKRILLRFLTAAEILGIPGRELRNLAQRRKAERKSSTVSPEVTFKVTEAVAVTHQELCDEGLFTGPCPDTIVVPSRGKDSTAAAHNSTFGKSWLEVDEDYAALAPHELLRITIRHELAHVQRDDNRRQLPVITLRAAVAMSSLIAAFSTIQAGVGIVTLRSLVIAMSACAGIAGPKIAMSYTARRAELAANRIAVNTPADALSFQREVAYAAIVEQQRGAATSPDHMGPRPISFDRSHANLYAKLALAGHDLLWQHASPIEQARDLYKEGLLDSPEPAIWDAVAVADADEETVSRARAIVEDPTFADRLSQTTHRRTAAAALSLSAASIAASLVCAATTPKDTHSDDSARHRTSSSALQLDGMHQLATSKAIEYGNTLTL
jgi:hypothetical protein